MTQAEKQVRDDAKVVAGNLVYVAVPALIGILSYAIFYWQKATVIIGTGIVLALASLLIGGLVGFLFGIPKSTGQRKPTKTAQEKTPTDATVQDRGGLHRNTNIEEISDWLTKIIVGLGIYELKNIPSLIRRFSAFLAPGFGDVPGAGAFAVILAVAFACTGFLFGYLLTVLFITGAIYRAEKAITDPEEKLEEDRKVAESFAQAVGAALPQGAVPEDVRKRVLELASRYERERASRAAGPQRTAAMESITREMRQLAVAAYGMLDDLTKPEATPGQRLAAAAFLQVQPRLEKVKWLTENLPKETPFVQYHMALALLAAVKTLPELGKDKEDWKKQIIACQKKVHRGSDEYRLLQQALDELDSRPD